MGAASVLMGELSPYLRHCGAGHRDAWGIGERSLLDYLLVYLEKGTGLYTIGGVEYEAEAGDLFWIPPNTIHRMEGFAPGNELSYVHFDLIYRPDVAHWDFSIPEGMIDLTEFGSLMHPSVALPEVVGLTGRIRSFNNERVGRMVNEIVLEAGRAQPYFGLRTSGMLLSMMAEVLRGQQGVASEQFSLVPAIEQAGDYLRERCHGPVGIEEAAAWAGLSVSYFRKLFSIHYGCSPRTYLRRARIQRAKELMATPRHNLTEIARMTGFSTVHAFSKAFHAVEGMSPSHYRRFGPSLTRVEGRKPEYPV
ncbi:MAG: AraC family transcriptional regulator [Planctomycetota bacterium]